MTQALDSTAPEQWCIPDIVERTYQIVMDSNDISLVGLAGRCRDAVPLCALRESTVVYEAAAVGVSEKVQFHYEWRVTSELERAAQEFRRAFSELVPNDMPEVVAANAHRFHSACADNYICGRCVRLGFDPKVTPNKHYHWAIYLKNSSYEVEEFWSDEVWTTERYRNAQRNLNLEKKAASGWWSKLWGK